MTRLTPEERFRGQGIYCLICGKPVPRVRIDQATCLSKECQEGHRDSHKLKGIKADHVRDLGQIQLP